MITCGTQIVSGAPAGTVSLPVTPAEALLDPTNAGKVVTLSDPDGIGQPIAADVWVEAATGLALTGAAEGDFLVSDGAGGSQRASDDTAAVRTLLAITSGPVAGSGTYASRPASPALGDSYTVTSGARTGSVYRCVSTGSWVLDRILPPTAITPMGWWDPERLEPLVGQSLMAWRGEGDAQPLVAGMPITTYPSALPTILAAVSAWGGLPAASWGANASALQSDTQFPMRADPRTLIFIVSNVDTGALRTFGGWGRSASSLRTFAMRAQTTVGLSFYGSDPAGSVAPSTTSTPQICVATYTGTNYALRVATLAASPSWSYSLSSAAASLGTYGGGFTMGCHPMDTANNVDLMRGRIHWCGVYGDDLSESDMNDVAIALYTRLQ